MPAKLLVTDPAAVLLGGDGAALMDVAPAINTLQSKTRRLDGDVDKTEARTMENADSIKSLAALVTTLVNQQTAANGKHSEVIAQMKADAAQTKADAAQLKVDAAQQSKDIQALTAQLANATGGGSGGGGGGGGGSGAVFELTQKAAAYSTFDYSVGARGCADGTDSKAPATPECPTGWSAKHSWRAFDQNMLRTNGQFATFCTAHVLCQQDGGGGGGGSGTGTGDDGNVAFPGAWGKQAAPQWKSITLADISTAYQESVWTAKFAGRKVIEASIYIYGGDPARVSRILNDVEFVMGGIHVGGMGAGTLRFENLRAVQGTYDVSGNKYSIYIGSIEAIEFPNLESIHAGSVAVYGGSTLKTVSMPRLKHLGITGAAFYTSFNPGLECTSGIAKFKQVYIASGGTWSSSYKC